MDKSHLFFSAPIPESVLWLNIPHLRDGETFMGYFKPCYDYFPVPLRVSVWRQSQIQEHYQWGGCWYHASATNWPRQRWSHVLVPVGSRSQCQNVHRRTGWSRWLFMEMHCQVSFIGIFSHLFVCFLL